MSARTIPACRCAWARAPPPLALVQTRAFLHTLTKFCPVLRGMDVFQEHAIRTTGDATQASGQRLADIGGKGLFSKEIHEALEDGRIDFAVHSLKDLETFLPPGIVLACTLTREDARDALILHQDDLLPDADHPYASLPFGAVVGSSSVRRQAQLLHARPDLQVKTIRGNVHGRLDKVKRGDFAASLLALAGMRRLGAGERGVRRAGHRHHGTVRVPGNRRGDGAGERDGTARAAGRDRGTRSPRRCPTRSAPCSRRWMVPAPRRSAAMPGRCRAAGCT